MPPLWQYLCALGEKKADEAFCAPKGFGTLAPWPFSLQNGTSEGAEGGAMGADHRPQQPAAVTSARGLGGEGRTEVRWEGGGRALTRGLVLLV
jgi:hypothetical protein